MVIDETSTQTLRILTADVRSSYLFVFFFSRHPHTRANHADEKAAYYSSRAKGVQIFPADPKTNRSGQLIVFN